LVRRSLQVALAVALLTFGGCSDNKEDPAIAAVCQTREQTQSAVDNSKPVSIEQYPEVIKGLEAAIEVAPNDIRDDFVVVHDVLKPFVDALVKAGGDTNVAAQDPGYAAIVDAVGTNKATAAGQHIQDYYSDHCG